MSGFSGPWLALREPVDSAARNGDVTSTLLAWTQSGKALRIVDLGAGTGANLRYLAPLLGGEQDWWLLDDDEQLLARAPVELDTWGRARDYRMMRNAGILSVENRSFIARVRCTRCNLATTVTAGWPGEVDLVTASALLDLVSADWLARLALECRHRQCAGLFALSYDGLARWHPSLAEDSAIGSLLNRHQLGNKGFGPALGPNAVSYADRCFAAAGFEVHTGDSDWRLGTEQREIQQVLANDWARAALELVPSAQPWVDAWLAARTGYIDGGCSGLTVGHQDLLVLPRTAVSQHP